MKTSEITDKIFPALYASQKAMGKLVKDSKNDFYKSTYASLEQVLDVVKGPLLENGIFITQGSGESEKGINVITRLIHGESGQWIETNFPIPLNKNDSQSAGGASSYGRRYAIKAIMALAEEDDDGNGSSDKEPRADRTEDSMKPITDKQKSQIIDLFASLEIEDQMVAACAKCSSNRTKSVDGLMESEAKVMIAKLSKKLIEKSPI
jgi:hypothetical protein